MATNTTWSVRHRCGHHIDWDLSHKPPDRRVGFAAWLALRDCNRCWWTKRRNPDRPSRAISRPQGKSRRRVTTPAWETATGMPALGGGAKAVGWARRIRHRLLLAGREHLGTGPGAEDQFAYRYAKPARRITSAAWWIDHRHVGPGELQRVLATSPHGSAAPSVGAGR
jgi:hypothetical protein